MKGDGDVIQQITGTEAYDKLIANAQYFVEDLKTHVSDR